MAVSPDPDEWADSDWVERSFADYHLEPHEKTSLAAIRENIAADCYESVGNCLQHLELLEHLSNKLMGVVQAERALGKENWDIEVALREVKELQGRLNTVYASLEREN